MLTIQHEQEATSLAALVRYMFHIINVGEGVEKREPYYTVSGYVYWYNHCGEQYGGSLKN